MCEVLDSQRIPLNEQARKKVQGRIPYYGANGIQGYINDFLFDEDLILIAEDGGYFDEYATRAIAYQIKGKSWVNNHAHILRAKSQFNQDYVYYSIVHKNILKYIQGGTRAKLNQKELRSILINIPEDKVEQTAIANILTTVEKAIENTEYLIAKCERIKAGMMHDLLTKGIDENGQVRSEKTHKFKDSPLGRIPEEWEVKRLGDIADVNRGKFDHRPRNAPQFYGGENPFIQTADISNCQSLYLTEYSQTLNNLGASISRKFPRETIVMSIAANIGDTAILGREMYVTDSVVAIQVKECHSVHYVQMQLQLRKDKLNRTASQSAQKNINLETLKPLHLPIPMTSDEQERISNTYLQFLQQVDQMRANLEKTTRIKIGLLHDLLSGQVGVPGEFIKKITEQAFVN